MSKDKEKISYKNNNFANSEPQLLRVQINSCEDLDSFDDDQVLINDYLKNNDSEVLPALQEANTVIFNSEDFVNNIQFGNFKIDEMQISKDLFNMKNSESKNDQIKLNQKPEVEILNFEKNSNSEELILPETQLVQNENLEFNDKNNLNNNETVEITPKYENIENDVLNFSNFESNLSEESNYFVSKLQEAKNQKDFEIDDNQWTLVPNFDFNMPKNSVKINPEILPQTNPKLEKINKISDNKDLKKSNKNLSKKEKNVINKKNNKSNSLAKNDAKEDIVSPDIIKVKSSKSNSKKINKEKTVKKQLENKKDKKQTKRTKSKSKFRKNDLFISSNDVLEVPNLNDNQTYIKPNNEIISNDLVLSNKIENNLFLSPLPVNAEKLQDYYENNFYLTKKSFNDSNKDLKKIQPVASLTSFKYKFKGPEIIVQDSFANNFLKLKKSKNQKK